VALAAVIAIPLYFDRHEITLDAACQLLARDIRALQNRAGFYKVPATMRFDQDGWRALDSGGLPVEGLGEDRPLTRRFSSDAVFEGVELRDLALGPDNALSIDARGLVTERAELVFVFGPDIRRVEIERGSGHVLVYDPNSGTRDEARLLVGD
jgi:hypothetical protein